MWIRSKMMKADADSYQEVSSQKKVARKKLLNFIDSLISLFLVTPLVVGFWRGLFDNFIIYNEMFEIFPVWISLGISWSVVLIYNVCRPNRSFTDSGRHVEAKPMTITARIRVYVFAVFCVMTWRCLFEASDIMFGESDKLIKLFLLRWDAKNNRGASLLQRNCAKIVSRGLTRTININFSLCCSDGNVNIHQHQPSRRPFPLAASRIHQGLHNFITHPVEWRWWKDWQYLLTQEWMEGDVATTIEHHHRNVIFQPCV